MRCRPQIGISSLLLQHRFSCNGRITAAKTVQRKLDICLAYSTRGSNVAAWLSTEILMELVVLSLSSAVRDIAQILWPVLRPPGHPPIRLHPQHIWSGSATVRASLFREAQFTKTPAFKYRFK